MTNLKQVSADLIFRVYLAEALVRQRKFQDALRYLLHSKSLPGMCNRGHIRLQVAGTLLAKYQRQVQITAPAVSHLLAAD